mgnify:FL=1
MSNFDGNRLEGSPYLSAGSLLQEYRFFIDAHASFDIIDQASGAWPMMIIFCEELERSPELMQAITRLHTVSQIDFERALFCSWILLVLARSLTFNEDQQRDLFYAGLLQDIGKHALKDNVQDMIYKINDKKQPPLSNNDIHDAHALVSSTYIEQQLPEHAVLRDLVLHHHARADGTGYPKYVGESQLDIDSQLLIIANEVSDRLDKLGGHNHLFECLPSLQLGRLLCFRRAYSAWCTLLGKASETAMAGLSAANASGSTNASDSNNSRIVLPKMQQLKECNRMLLDTSAALVQYDSDITVRGLRSSIETLVFLSSETGIIEEGAFVNLADISTQEASEVKALLEALTGIFERIEHYLEQIANTDTYNVDEDLLRLASMSVKQCLLEYGIIKNSVFR